MFADIKRRFIITQLGLLTFFVWGVGFFYLVSTMLFNPVQLRWEMICFGWEAIAFGVPLIIFRPMLRSIERYAAVLESGRALGPEALAVYERQVLTYPFKVSIEVGLLSTLAPAVAR